MDLNTRASGIKQLIKNMEKAVKFGQMVAYMKDIGKIVSQMEEGD